MKTSQVKCAYFFEISAYLFEISLDNSENPSTQRVLAALSVSSLRISNPSDHVWKVF
jgi:hypothetical protein